ncbi:hypothetical protein A4X17_11220 [Plantibacter sp. H53]|uniref:SGNH/GDSL hydrolase family protein n=1 Tax=Plantibacter sp. H53 TaxID=1827323 RepID=UPI0007D8DDEC|nr:SGNH/GDSL hydrolase family protein [Plantibacter sp. H53]OAN35046.1 hypothetical protein A4X17_11220 [Plantibacter sp. H53]
MVNYLVSVDSETKELPDSVKNALPFNPQTIVDARVDGGNVWLVRDNESEIPLGDLTGPAGPNTVPTETAIATALTNPGAPRDALEAAVNAELVDALVPYPSMVTAGENFAAKVDLLADNMAVGLAGDSTGDENAEWFRRGHELWLPLNPALACDYTRWDIATETNSPAIALQTSTGSLVVAAEDSFSRTAADLIGSGSPEAGNSWSGETGKFSVDGSAAVVTAAPGNVQAVGTVQGGDRLSTWSVTVDTNAKAVGGVLNLHAGASASNRVWVYISIAASGAVTWGIQKQIAGVFANVVNGTGTPLTASSVQTVPVTLRLNGTTVTATLNGVSVTATLSAGDVSALATATNTYITTTGAGAVGWKIESVKVVVTVAPKKLTIYNASKAGSTLDYQAAHIAAMFPAPLDLLFISSCHNYGSDSAEVYLTKVLTFIDAFRAIHPETGIVVVAQNPEFPPNATHEAHRKRLASLRGFAKRHNFGYLPAAEAFQKRPDGGVAAVRVDGVHPKAAFELADPNNGSYIWAAALRDWYTKLSLLV